MTVTMKDIPGYEGRYAVTQNGKVWSYPKYHQNQGRFMSPCKPCGYESVELSVDCIKKRFLVHRLVAITFIPNPNNLPQINHKNGIRNDNRVENLEWCTASENITHSYRVLGHTISENHRKALAKSCIETKSKPITQLDKNREVIKHFSSIAEASRKVGVLRSALQNCLWGRSKTCGGSFWVYL